MLPEGQYGTKMPLKNCFKPNTKPNKGLRPTYSEKIAHVSILSLCSNRKWFVIGWFDWVKGTQLLGTFFEIQLELPILTELPLILFSSKQILSSFTNSTSIFIWLLWKQVCQCDSPWCCSYHRCCHCHWLAIAITCIPHQI